MTNLSKANQELYRRTPDETFATMQAFGTIAIGSGTNPSTAGIPPVPFPPRRTTPSCR